MLYKLENNHVYFQAASRLTFQKTLKDAKHTPYIKSVFNSLYFVSDKLFYVILRHIKSIYMVKYIALGVQYHFISSSSVFYVKSRINWIKQILNVLVSLIMV